MESSAKREERNIKRREEKQRKEIRGEISNTVINGFREINSLNRGGRMSQDKLSVSSERFDMVDATVRNVVQKNPNSFVSARRFDMIGPTETYQAPDTSVSSLSAQRQGSTNPTVAYIVQKNSVRRQTETSRL